MKLSVVVATYNEADNIGRCLESVKDLAQEIVVVDGDSSDKTVEIAKGFKARVVVTDNPAIFHINKQKAIDLAQGDWILQLDADERVTPEFAFEIKKAITKKEFYGYWIPRKNYFLGRYLTKGGAYPDYTLRLYRRGKGRLPQKGVHEQAVVEGKTAYLTEPLLHLADPTLSRYFLRNNRYTDLIAEELRQEKRNPLVKAVLYLLVKPSYWFFMLYIRHKGFMDSWQGFVFAFLSGLRFPIGYIKYLINS